MVNAQREVIRLVASYENIVQREQSCMLPYLSVPIYLDDQLVGRMMEEDRAMLKECEL